MTLNFLVLVKNHLSYSAGSITLSPETPLYNSNTVNYDFLLFLVNFYEKQIMFITHLSFVHIIQPLHFSNTIQVILT